MKGKYAEVSVPAYFVTGWYDNPVHEMFKCFAVWKNRAGSPEARLQTKMLIGPWIHSQIGGASPGFDTEIAIAQQTIFHNSQYPSHLLLPVIPRR